MPSGLGKNRKADKDAANKRMIEAHAAASKPSELQTLIDKRSMETLNWGSAPGKDIRSLSTIEPFLQLATQARNRAGQERQATGAFALGGNGASGHASILQNQREKEADQQAGALVEDAYTGAVNQAYGWAPQSIGLTNQRQLGVLGMASQNWNQAAHRAYQPGMWGQLGFGALNRAIHGVNYSQGGGWGFGG